MIEDYVVIKYHLIAFGHDQGRGAVQPYYSRVGLEVDDLIVVMWWGSIKVRYTQY